MATFKKNIKAILLCVGLAAVICIAAVLVRPSYAQMGSTGLWLSQYQGEVIRVTFVSAPMDLDKISALRLVKAEQSGIVVTFGNKRTVFYPYSHIISIEPPLLIN
jgi:hypothetical protein